MVRNMNGKAIHARKRTRVIEIVNEIRLIVEKIQDKTPNTAPVCINLALCEHSKALVPLAVYVTSPQLSL